MAPEPVDDQTLVNRTLTGDLEAANALLTRYASYIRGIAVHSIPDDVRTELDADYILQDLFLNILVAVRSFVPTRGTFRGYLGGVTRVSVQEAARIVRREKARRIYAGPEKADDEAEDWLTGVAVAPSGESPSRAARRNEIRAVVKGLLDRLPEEDRNLIVRCDIDDEPHAGVAADLKISTGAVAMRLFRIRLRCREMLGPENDYFSTIYTRNEQADEQPT